MKRDVTAISDLHLEQFVLGELSLHDEKRIREALEVDELLRARLAEIERSNREIVAQYPPEAMAPAIEERAGDGAARARRRRPSVAFILPVAAAALLFLSFFALREQLVPLITGGQLTQDTRIKGMSPHLSIFKKTPSGAAELAAGDVAHARDVLQISYVAADARYGAIFSIDGRGVVTFHLPEQYSGQALSSPELDRQGPVILPYAYELDDAPSFERFVLVYAKAPFDLREIDKAAQAVAARPQSAETQGLRLPAGVSSFSFVVRKQG